MGVWVFQHLPVSPWLNALTVITVLWCHHFPWYTMKIMSLQQHWCFSCSLALSLSSSSSGIATQFERLSKMPVSASTVCVCVHTLHTSTACLCTSLHPCNCCTSLCVNCIFPLMNTCPAAVTANECVSVPPVPCINQLPLGHTVQISLLVSAKEELISLNQVPMRLIRWW